MRFVNELLHSKQSSLYTIDACDTVLEATQLMNERSIGAIIVTNANRLIGIFTERDVLRRVVAAERSPGLTRVAEVMTAEVLLCSADTTVEEAREIMMSRRIRHLPIVDDEGTPIGMVSIGDLNAHQVREQQMEIGHLHEYLYGRT